MSESENGAIANTTSTDSEQQRNVVSPGRTLGARSASPAKRSAADMEENGEKGKKVPGSFTKDDDSGPSDFDTFMQGMTAAASGTNTQDTQTQASSTAASADASMSTETTATSFASEDDQTSLAPTHTEPYSTEETDKQVQYVYHLLNKPLDEGDRGVVISVKWMSRVMSRTSENLKSGQYPKEAREGPVGPLDNSNIIVEGALQEPYLKDTENADFIPLRPGLAWDTDYQILPYDAYGYIVGTYGHTTPTKPVVRYAHNTAPDEATQSNIQYEVYPPVITVRKVPQPISESEQPAKAKPGAALDALRLKREREGRGQRSAEEAAKLVSSSTEPFQKFLARAKEAAGIPLSRKVKIWRLSSPEEVAVNEPGNQQSGVPSPPASRDTSPGTPSPVKLVVDKEVFEKMEVGKDMEPVDSKDQTHDGNYNGKGKFDMDTAGLKGPFTILLEEQIGGPAGGEFQSDGKKIVNRVFNRKSAGSKLSSTQSSGRTSPAPGIMSRGRTRRGGRTRGVLGLMNLGNTCYMNSALQCIRSVEELAVFFLSNKYKGEINNDNPLGHHGAMANAYAAVLRGIYESSSGGAYSPSNFKKTLGGIQPMFSGYGQQDSQEFLSFLVDALHEDLNRIVKKPYIENPDSDDSKVQDKDYILELGQIYRDNHRKRNDSVAMDLFSGFYKNTMECPVCDKVSVTFDPYSLLTVQLPMDHAFQHVITFIPLRGRPVLHEIDMDKNSTFKTLKEHIAKKHPGVDANSLWVVEVYSHKLYKTFDDASTLAEASINRNDYIFMYELDEVPKNAPSTKKTYSTYGFSYNSKKEDEVPSEGMDSPKADVFAVPIFQRMRKSATSSSMDSILYPLYISLTREEAQNYEVILKKVLIAVSNVTTRPILTEYDEGRAPSGTVEELNGDEELHKVQATGEDSAGVSDHSAQSEDGYVNVSLDRPAITPEHANRASPGQVDEVDRRIPAGFMDSQYFLSPALRNHLFELKYAESSDGNMHCASMSGYKDMSVRTMFDRVKKPSRRASQSSDSDKSTTSTGSGHGANADSDESDSDKPDIYLGGENSLSAATVEDSGDEGTEETSGDIMEPSTVDESRNSRKRTKHRGRKKGGKSKRNGALNGTGRHQQRYGLSRGTFSLTNKPVEDGPYYVQLGECILLDWRPEAYDSLFGGDPRDAEEMRGLRITDDNGRNGPIFEDEELNARKAKRDERKKNGIDLEDCFVETGKREVLSEDNAWYCNRCKGLRQAHKTLEIWTLPDILVVHMKRFGGTRSFRDKIDVFVDYPIEGLDMTDKVGVKEDGKEYVYDLFAVDNHFGGLGGGHYTAYAKNFYDGEWYDYNDSITGKLGSGGGLKSPAAYLLFYRRRSDKPLGPQALQELVLEYRKPESESADEAEEESGEVKLGGPTVSSQHRNGSSSVLAGPGVAVTSNPRALGVESGGVGVDSRLTPKQTKTTTTNEYERGHSGSIGIAGLLNHNQPDSWNFSGIDSEDHLLDGMHDDHDHDHDSTKAEHDDEQDDRDSGIGGSSTNGMDLDGPSTYNTPNRAHTSPMEALLGDFDDDDEFEDDHHFQDASNTLHIEHGAIESVEEAQAHDIVLEDAPAQGDGTTIDEMD